MGRLLAVAGSLGSVLTGLIPLALVTALSPLSIIPAVLVLDTPRPRPTSLAFLGGWVLGLTALTALFVAGSGVLGGLHKSPPTWASWLRVVLGSALIAFGIYRWFTRDGSTESPRWMRSFSSLAPARAAITGAVLTVVRPEVLIVCLAAGVSIGTAGLRVTVAIPILAFAGAGHRLDDALARLKDWMQRHNAALLAAVLIVIGLMVLYKGIDAL
jgi:Sap, sulfolipid-1-addressing protein